MSIEQPWVEKYRPRHLDEVVGQEKIVNRLKQFVSDTNSSMPHLIFAGPAGTGKTTCAIALVRDILKGNMKNNQTYLELNASDARGIDVIRTLVKDFAKGMVPDNVPFKILILDEADNMTDAAQQALRRTMENYTHTCRMILICNYSNKIILPIQSRCVVFRFGPVGDDDIRKRIESVAKMENVKINEDGLKAIVYVSNGDLRRGVNYLQACSTVSGEVTQEVVYRITGKIHPNEIIEMMNIALKGQLMKAKEMLDKFVMDYGLSARNLVSQMHTECYRMNIEELMKMKIIRVLSQIDYRLSQGATEQIQLNALLAKLTLLNAP
jgi:replication factor C small subunit